MLKGFKEFILRGNFLDLAVGVVVGASFTSVVNSVVKDLLTPFIGIFTQGHEFANWSFSIHGSKFLIGDLINNLIAFLLAATAVYFFVVMPMNTFMRKFKGDPMPTTKKCPECLSDIPIKAKRCSACTQPVS